jgi:catechol 2,3-dioxygenase-like lactoylglutathione lyase family enzyme
VHVLAARVLLRPTDFDAAIEFYERRLGLVRFREWGAPPRRGIAYFLGGGYLELSQTPPDETPPPAPAGVRLWLQVADIGRTCRELDERGVTIAEAPERKPWGLIEAIVHDPDGLPLVIVETPPDHPLRRRD